MGEQEWVALLSRSLIAISKQWLSKMVIAIKPKIIKQTEHGMDSRKPAMQRKHNAPIFSGWLRDLCIPRCLFFTYILDQAR